jgi:hypothetical protein
MTDFGLGPDAAQEDQLTGALRWHGLARRFTAAERRRLRQALTVCQTRPARQPQDATEYCGHPHFTEEDLEVLAAELERLNRAWRPRYHSSG